MSGMYKSRYSASNSEASTLQKCVGLADELIAHALLLPLSRALALSLRCNSESWADSECWSWNRLLFISGSMLVMLGALVASLFVALVMVRREPGASDNDPVPKHHGRLDAVIVLLSAVMGAFWGAAGSRVPVYVLGGLLCLCGIVQVLCTALWRPHFSLRMNTLRGTMGSVVAWTGFCLTIDPDGYALGALAWLFTLPIVVVAAAALVHRATLRQANQQAGRQGLPPRLQDITNSAWHAPNMLIAATGVQGVAVGDKFISKGGKDRVAMARNTDGPTASREATPTPHPSLRPSTMLSPAQTAASVTPVPIPSFGSHPDPGNLLRRATLQATQQGKRRIEDVVAQIARTMPKRRATPADASMRKPRASRRKGGTYATHSRHGQEFIRTVVQQRLARLQKIRGVQGYTAEVLLLEAWVYRHCDGVSVSCQGRVKGGGMRGFIQVAVGTV